MAERDLIEASCSVHKDAAAARPEHKELADAVVVLGDQSPCAGGLTRLEAVQGYAGRVEYFIQDADAPWLQDGDRHVNVKRGWPSYWALANRHPFSLEVPSTAVHNMRDSLRSPRGLSYLSGPRTDITIASGREHQTLAVLLKQMMLEEADWATKVCEYGGYTDGVMRGRGVKDKLEACEVDNPLDLTRQVAGWNGTNGRLGSFLEMNRQESPQLVGVLPDDHYWVVDNNGIRRPYDRRVPLSRGDTLLPKGRALPLEVAVKGAVLGFTNLGYLDDTLELRDRFVPNLPLKTVQIAFDWRVDFDPIEPLWQEFKARKIARGQEVTKPEAELGVIGDYWRRRPTTISHMIMGGEVNPSLTYREL